MGRNKGDKKEETTRLHLTEEEKFNLSESKA